MKANVNRMDKISSGIVLSIGMIVKNEEKTIGETLSALKPLLDNVKSELVIVDTGSTDRTVEIASLYTDNIYYFEWINDFSAARNYGLKKCSGEWFMFIDADEAFVDVSEMIEFFNNSDINRKYNSASYIIRNQKSTDDEAYSDFLGSRIVRLKKDTHFQGKIHEHFSEFLSPMYSFKSYAKHSGYIFETQLELSQKQKRNLDLIIAELEENPDNLRTLCHFFDVGKFHEKKEFYINKALKLARKTNENYSLAALYKIAVIRTDECEYEEALKIFIELEKRLKNDAVFLVSIYAYKGFIYDKLENFEEAEISIKKYLDYYEKYNKNELDSWLMLFCTIYYVNDEKRDELKKKLAYCIAKQNRTNDAIAVFSDVDFDGIYLNEYKELVDMFFEFTSYSIEFDKLTEVCDKINLSCNQEKINYLNVKLENKLYHGSLSKRFKPQYGDFAELLSFMQTPNAEKIKEFINKFNPLPKGLSEAFYIAIKNNVDLRVALEKMNFEILNMHLSLIAVNHSDFSECVLQYQDTEFFTLNIKNLTFALNLYEKAVAKSDNLDFKQKSKLYKSFAVYASLYVGNIFNPEIFNETDISSLGELYRFGFYMAAAEKEYEEKNTQNYIKILNDARNSCESMSEIISFMIDNFSVSTV